MSLWGDIVRRAFVTLVVAVGLLLLSRAAHAWTESHLQSSDARVHVDEDGAAEIDLVLGIRVASGALRETEIQNVRADALDTIAEVKGEDGSTQNASVTFAEDVAHLVFDGKGLKRGVWNVRLHGRARLSAAADGSFFRISWQTPIAREGMDGARVVFDLPAGPTEPHVVRADAALGDLDDKDNTGIVATLRRSPDRDELELVRPHIARGESATWTARVDPKSLPRVHHPSLEKAPPPPPPHAKSNPWILVAISIVFGALFGFLVWKKDARILRALVGLLSMSGAIYFELDRKMDIAAIFVVVATLSATVRAPEETSHPARGIWRAAKDISLPPDSPFDVVRALVGLVALVVVARVLQRYDDLAPVFVAIDSVALVPLFLTGNDLGPRVREIQILTRMRERLSDLVTALWSRVPRDGGSALEHRLIVMPRAPMPGLEGIEIALAWDRSGRSWEPSSQVLVRTREGSSAHKRMLESSRSEPGRTTDERVFRFEIEPAEPFVREVAAMLEERRRSHEPFEGSDRRAMQKRVRIAA